MAHAIIADATKSTTIVGETHVLEEPLKPPATQARRMAWATMCVQHTTSNAAVLDACLTSIGSLMLTQPHVDADVVALMDDLALAAIGPTLRRIGVTTYRLQPVDTDVAALRRDWAALRKRKRRHTTVPRAVLALHKMQVWTLVAYDAILYFDPDVLFLRAASALLSHSPPFAAIRLRRSAWGCKGQDYLNAGVILLAPSHARYMALRGTFVHGNFTDCGGSSATLDDQDVVRHLAFETRALGAFHAWPLCFNYRAWPSQVAQCKQPMLIHQERRTWPHRVLDRDGASRPVSSIADAVRSADATPPYTLTRATKPYVVLERYWNASKVDVAREQARPPTRTWHLCVCAPSDGPVFDALPSDGPVLDALPSDGPVSDALPSDGPMFAALPSDGPVVDARSLSCAG
jgi:hypothetical protein